jgi:hypothetical protein
MEKSVLPMQLLEHIWLLHNMKRHTNKLQDFQYNSYKQKCTQKSYISFSTKTYT